MLQTTVKHGVVIQCIFRYWDFLLPHFCINNWQESKMEERVNKKLIRSNKIGVWGYKTHESVNKSHTCVFTKPSPWKLTISWSWSSNISAGNKPTSCNRIFAKSALQSRPDHTYVTRWHLALITGVLSCHLLEKFPARIKRRSTARTRWNNSSDIIQAFDITGQCLCFWRRSSKFVRFWAFDLDLWPMTLTYNPNLAKVKVDPHTKNQGRRFSRESADWRTDGRTLPSTLSPSLRGW